MPELAPNEGLTDAEIARIATALANTDVFKQAYADVLSPTLKEFGSAGAQIGSIVKGLFRGIAYVTDAVGLTRGALLDAARSIPEEYRVVPSPRLAIPAIEGLASSEAEPDIAAMFKQLLASSMDARRAGSVHPAFAEMIKGMASDEARLLSRLWHLESAGSVSLIPLISISVQTWGKPLGDEFGAMLARTRSIGPSHWAVRRASAFPQEAGCHEPSRFPMFLARLASASLVWVDEGTVPPSQLSYASTAQTPEIQAHKHLISPPYDSSQGISRQVLEWAGLTELGTALCAACVPTQQP